MRLLKIKIRPKSTFVTFPKGDMIFGHFVYLSYQNNENIFDNYQQADKPIVIFSDFLPDGYLKKPSLPLKMVGIDEAEKKNFRKKEWISIDDLQNGRLSKAKEIEFVKYELRVRNSINRLSFSTDGEGFDPYSEEEFSFVKQPVLYLLYDDEFFSDNEIIERINDIGKTGFGKKGSIGRGSFDAYIDVEFSGFESFDTAYYMTLSTSLLNKNGGMIEQAYYDLFTRFGKHHGSGKPYKKPVIMAQSSAVLKLSCKSDYIGRVVDNGIESKSFIQGHSILVPMKMEE